MFKKEAIYERNATPAQARNGCLFIATAFHFPGDHYRSSIWMQQALRKWNEEEDKSVEKAEILEYLAFSLYAQGNMRRALREGIVRNKRAMAL